MPKRYARPLVSLACGLAAVVIGSAGPAGAASKDLDLDGTVGNESNATLTVVSASPVKIRNKITNKAVGKAFTFNWVSAGPGGFASSVVAGTAAGVATQWDWTTVSTVYSYTGSTCPTDLCFTETSPTPGTARGPFSAPGRSLTAGGVTLSSASLTSSLISFFSPAKVLVTLTSSVKQLTSGWFRYTTRVENFTPEAIDLDLLKGPPPCAGCIVGQTVPPGGVFEVCQTDPHPSMEEPFQLFICGNSIPDGPDVVRCQNNQPATLGMANILAPNMSKMLGDVFITPYQVQVLDVDGNGLFEPGETASLNISLLNAGPVPLTAVVATLTSPPIDLNNDGVSDMVFIDPLQDTSPYPDIPGTPATGSGDCNNFALAGVNPVLNQTPFMVHLPTNHPGEVARPFNLHVSGQPAGPGPSFSMDVPITIGVGAACPAPTP